MRRLKETRQSLHAGVLDEGELVLRKAKDGWEERRELMAAASRAVSHLSDTISRAGCVQVSGSAGSFRQVAEVEPVNGSGGRPDRSLQDHIGLSGCSLGITESGDWVRAVEGIQGPDSGGVDSGEHLCCL